VRLQRPKNPEFIKRDQYGAVDHDRDAEFYQFPDQLFGAADYMLSACDHYDHPYHIAQPIKYQHREKEIRAKESDEDIRRKVRKRDVYKCIVPKGERRKQPPNKEDKSV